MFKQTILLSSLAFLVIACSDDPVYCTKDQTQTHPCLQLSDPLLSLNQPFVAHGSFREYMFAPEKLVQVRRVVRDKSYRSIWIYEDGYLQCYVFSEDVAYRFTCTMNKVRAGKNIEYLRKIE